MELPLTFENNAYVADEELLDEGHGAKFTGTEMVLDCDKMPGERDPATWGGGHVSVNNQLLGERQHVDISSDGAVHTLRNELSLGDGSTAGDKSSQSSDAGSRSITHQEQEECLRYGIGACKPDGLQRCNNPKVLLACMCWFSFCQGFLISGISNVVTSSLERRFELSSAQVGFVSSSNDFAGALVSIPISYYGTFAHHPRMLSVGALCLAVGSLIMALPHWTTGIYELKDAVADQCFMDAGNATDLCGYSKGLSNYLGVLILGMMVNAVGGTILYTVGTVTLDNIAHGNNSPLYIGFFEGSSALGPAVGYLLGGYILDTLYVDADAIDVRDLELKVDDPRWVGAWWIGYLASSIMMLTVMVMMLPFPRELPIAREVRDARVSETHNDGSEQVASRENFGTTWRDMPISLKLLLKNPIYILVTLAGVMEGMLVSGLGAFLVKIIQNQFAQSAGTAAMLAGGAIIIGAVAGHVIGGAIPKWAKLQVRGILKQCIICTLIAAVMSTSFLINCDPPQMAGINVGYVNSSIAFPEATVYQLPAACNQPCGCTTVSYEPACGHDGTQYFSACYAGCLVNHISSGPKEETTLVNCSCIVSAPDILTPNTTSPPQPPEAVPGGCPLDCNMLYPFLILFLLLMFATFLVTVPIISLTLRCIPDRQRAFGLGVQGVIGRLLGAVPGPLIIGAVLDSTCLVWQEKCGDTGSCWVYDNHSMSVRIFALVLCVKLLSTAFFSLALCLYKPPPEQPSRRLAHPSEAQGQLAAVLNKTVALPTPASKYIDDNSNAVPVN